jgi:hypothetical protein
MLPAITAAGRVHDSRDGWIDRRMVGDGESRCKYPGVRMFLELSECTTHAMATDILGDGMLLEFKYSPIVSRRWAPKRRWQQVVFSMRRDA